MTGVVSAGGTMLFLVGIVSGTIPAGAALFLLWNLSPVNKYLRLRLALLRAEQDRIRQDT